MLGKRLRTLVTRNLIRSLGVGGGLAGALLLAYELVLPLMPTWGRVLLVTGILGAVSYQLLFIVVLRRLSYYVSLLELYLLRQLIGQQARVEITRELTFNYFLGDSNLRTGEFFPKGREEIRQERRPTLDGAVSEVPNGAARGDGSAAY